MLATPNLLSHFYFFRMNVNMFHQQTGKVPGIRDNYRWSVWQIATNWGSKGFLLVPAVYHLCQDKLQLRPWPLNATNWRSTQPSSKSSLLSPISSLVPTLEHMVVQRSFQNKQRAAISSPAQLQPNSSGQSFISIAKETLACVITHFISRYYG